MRKKQNTSSLDQFITSYFEEIQHCLSQLDKRKIEKAITMIIEAYEKEKRIFILGNGGSASTASHFSCDLGKGTLQRIYDFSEKRFRIISLTDNTALITALANDLSYDEIFVQQLQNLLEPNDLVIGISGSGNSKNVIKAIEYARKCRAKTIGLLGFTTGGKLAKMVDCAITVNSNHYGPIEDIHMLLTHLISSWISLAIHNANKKTKHLQHTNAIFSWK